MARNISTTYKLIMLKPYKKAALQSLYSASVMYGTPNGGGSTIYNPDRNEIWNAMAGNYGSIGFTRIDPDTGETLGTIAGVTPSTGIEDELLYPRYDVINHRIYIGGANPTAILKFNSINATFIGSMAWPGIQWFGVHPITGNLWATTGDTISGRLQEKDALTGTLLRDVAMPGGAGEITFDSAGHVWLISQGLTKYNAATNQFSSFLNVISPDASTVFTCNGSVSPSTKWRVNITSSNGANAQIGVTEFQFRQTAGVPSILSGGVATASAQENSTFSAAANAADGNYIWNGWSWTTPYGSGGGAGWWQYEFPSPVTIHEYAIHPVWLQSAPKNFTLEYLSGSTWMVADTRINQIVWPVEGGLSHFAYDPIRNSIWFTTSYGNMLKEFDIATASISKAIPCNVTGYGFATDVLYDSYRNLIWTFNRGIDTCKAYNTNSGELLLSIDIYPEYPYKTNAAPNGIWINDSSWQTIERLKVATLPVDLTVQATYHENDATSAHVIAGPNNLLCDIAKLQNDNNYEVWFLWTPASSGIAQIDTVGARTVFDTNITLYAADGTTLLAYNDDSGDQTWSSLITYNVTSDNSYYIAVRYTHGKGTFQLNVSK